MSLLQGHKLIDVLRTTTADVKVFTATGAFLKVPAATALHLVHMGSYEGGGSSKRVRFIREAIDTRRPNVADHHHWEGRGCRHYDKPVTRETVDLWDLILRRQAEVVRA